ncbi:MAG: HRDC domain-containing protein [Pseudomonadota bacterium]
MNRATPAIEYIDSQSTLDAVTARVAAASHAGFDSEFLREKTYYPELCLLQLAVEGEIFVVDPLARMQLDAFWLAMLDTPLTLHSGRQDLEVLRVTTDTLPSTLMDTQVMAGIAGWSPQVGYATLVKEITGVTLDKAHTRTNWKRRPLSVAVLDYAADDVRHLGEITAHLEEKLTSLGRLEWARADSAALLDPALYENPPAAAWQRVKGIGRLPARVQQRVVSLAAWREALAQQRNLPRQWVVRDDALIAIAFDNPEHADDVTDVQGVPAKFATRHGKAVVQALREPLPPAPVMGGPPDDEEKRRAKAMAAALRALAKDMELEAEVLAPQREVRSMAGGDREVRALTGWRKDVVGPAIADLMP